MEIILDDKTISWLKGRALHYALGRVDAFHERERLGELALMFPEYPPVVNPEPRDINDIWDDYVKELRKL